jgi:hypothetical protein
MGQVSEATLSKVVLFISLNMQTPKATTQILNHWLISLIRYTGGTTQTTLRQTKNKPYDSLGTQT